MKTCYICKQDKELSDFSKNRSNNDGLSYECRSCQTLRYRKWMRDNWKRLREKSKKWTMEHPELVKKYAGKTRAKNHEKTKARNLFHYAWKTGRIQKLPCEVCSSTTKIQGHHYLGYEGEHWKDVQWLCSKHHGEADIEQRAKLKEVKI